MATVGNVQVRVEQTDACRISCNWLQRSGLLTTHFIISNNLHTLNVTDGKENLHCKFIVW